MIIFFQRHSKHSRREFVTAFNLFCVDPSSISGTLESYFENYWHKHQYDTSRATRTEHERKLFNRAILQDVAIFRIILQDSDAAQIEKECFLAEFEAQIRGRIFGFPASGCVPRCTVS
jgi:hypothetical protein